ncbi:MAG: hypothetical protein R3D30_07305 [Hyphomicrobiales bacterium]
MGAINEHGKLITAAARSALTPLGCNQISRSRTWISDERFWVIQIEFQPSGWSKGSYLNVGASWLWRVQKSFAFDYGYRVADFIVFETQEQFAPLIAGHARRAAEEVNALRNKFKTLAQIHRHLMDDIPRGGWALYHAAVAAGLSGDIAVAKQLFYDFDAWANSPTWPTKLESPAVQLASLLSEPDLYRAQVSSIIDECRALNGLMLQPNCLEYLAAG